MLPFSISHPQPIQGQQSATDAPPFGEPFHEPGDSHELTFSCYRRMQILTNDDWRQCLSHFVDHPAAAWPPRQLADY